MLFDAVFNCPSVLINYPFSVKPGKPWLCRFRPSDSWHIYPIVFSWKTFFRASSHCFSNKYFLRRYPYPLPAVKTLWTFYQHPYNTFKISIFGVFLWFWTDFKKQTESTIKNTNSHRAAFLQASFSTTESTERHGKNLLYHEDHEGLEESGKTPDGHDGPFF